ncbi:MAG: hypothetical protein JWP29_3279, partial [Rhodoferax sp.]|nr:hypothetical protein [Rhodoferax sp.]
MAVGTQQHEVQLSHPPRITPPATASHLSAMSLAITFLIGQQQG